MNGFARSVERSYRAYIWDRQTHMQIRIGSRTTRRGRRLRMDEEREKRRKAARKACSDAVLWLLRTHTPAEVVGTLERLKIGICMSTMKENGR